MKVENIVGKVDSLRADALLPKLHPHFRKIPEASHRMQVLMFTFVFLAGS
ncbi:hypothetical protein [Virgibacillus siamensis]|nr:hypothetical protein [Virgibacillus siamensis]